MSDNLAESDRIEIKFIHLGTRQFIRGLIGTSVFVVPLLLLAALALVGLLDGRPQFNLALSVASLFWLGSGTIFGWIWRDFTRNSAAVLNNEGIRAWSTLGYQFIRWDKVTEICIQRPIGLDPAKFLAITIDGNKRAGSSSFAPKIVLSTDIMTLDVREVMSFLRNKRPDLCDHIPLPH